jgi:Beta/Gamma crystallin
MAVAVTALAFTAASAQMGRHGHGRYLVLFEKPYFQGRSVTIEGPVPQLDAYNFNDKAQSARVRGAWVLCAAKFFKNDCVTINRDIPELKQVNMNRRATSVRPR